MPKLSSAYYSSKIDEVISWFNFETNNTVNISFVHRCECCYYPEINTIELDSGLPKRALFYTLLHEIGHYFVHKDNNYNKLFPKLKNDIQTNLGRPGVKRRHRSSGKYYRLERVLEEFKAWEAGVKIAERLDIKLNRKYFIDHMEKCLITYVNWCSEKVKPIATM